MAYFYVNQIFFFRETLTIKRKLEQTNIIIEDLSMPELVTDRKISVVQNSTLNL